MTYLIWAFIALTAFGALFQITQIGKPRPPITPATAVLGVILSGCWITGYLWILGRVG